MSIECVIITARHDTLQTVHFAMSENDIDTVNTLVKTDAKIRLKSPWWFEHKYYRIQASRIYEASRSEADGSSGRTILGAN